MPQKVADISGYGTVASMTMRVRLLGLKESKATKESKDPKAFRVTKAMKDPKAFKAIKAAKAIKDPKVLRVRLPYGTIWAPTTME